MHYRGIIPPTRNKTWEINCFQGQSMHKQLSLKGSGPCPPTAVLSPDFFLDSNLLLASIWNEMNCCATHKAIKTTAQGLLFSPIKHMCVGSVWQGTGQYLAGYPNPPHTPSGPLYGSHSVFSICFMLSKASGANEPCRFGKVSHSVL